jgi:putative peptide zinc metalloprotease protein
MCFMGLCWQLEFFMRTDVYFVAMDLLRCKNLYESSLASLKHRAARLWQLLARRPATADPLESLPPRERLRVRIYSYFVLVGSAWTLGVAALLGLPIMIEMFIRAGVSVFRGVAERDAWAFSDGMVTIVIEGGLQVLFVITFLKNRRPWLAALRRRLFAS